MKMRILLFSLMLAVAGVARASVYSYTFNVGSAIPDNGTPNNSGSVVIPQDAGVPVTPTIQDISVQLNISGGWNGDLYGYLINSSGSGFAVLLNRVGRDPSTPFGYGDAGFNFTIAEPIGTGELTPGSFDIHTYGAHAPTFVNGQLTGTWLSDGRNVDPATTLTSNGRTALLGSFIGLNANDTYTLFLADMAPGDVSTLVSWGLTIAVVPEPTTWAMIIFGVLAGLTQLVRWRMRKVAA